MATVIKANGPIRAADGMSFNFDDMSDKAHSYLDDMQKRAAQIIATAHKEAEKIRQRATEEGRQAAIAAVEQVMDEKVGKQLQTLLPALRQAAHEVAEAKQAWLSHWETAAVQLAGKIAERVVQQRIGAADAPRRPAGPTKPSGDINPRTIRGGDGIHSTRRVDFARRLPCRYQVWRRRSTDRSPTGADSRGT
jgi:F0F1-type ATP synthase membrane subunit b/b'